MAIRTLTAMFNTREEARRAADLLLNDASLGHPTVEVLPAEGTANVGSTGYSGTTAIPRPQEDQGLFASLRSLFIPEEDRYAYAEGMRRGAVLVVTKVDEAHVQSAMDILEREGAVDFDQQEAAWRQEGWTGYQAAGTTAGTGIAGSAMTDTDSVTATTSAPTGMQAAGVGTGMAVGSTASTAATARDTAATGREERIPIVEEQLRVGKREVSGGRVRVRSYVVETPVEEQVTLREETISVERRPVDRPLSGSEADAFRERTIEASAKREEAVVSKEARVKEELVLNKQTSERTETVSDKVRETRVEVEDGRNSALPGTTADTAGATGHTSTGAISGTASGTVQKAEASVDRTLNTNLSGTNPGADAPDGTGNNPPSTKLSRGVDEALGTNISGANPARK